MSVTFDGVNKLITCTPGTTSLSIQTDVYSAWKDWILIADNSKYLQAISYVGGDPISPTLDLGSTYFLENAWKIRPQEANHTLDVVGNIYSRDGSVPFVQTISSYNVMVINKVSNLVDTTIAQLPEIEYASFNGGITIDAVSGTDSASFPYGTPASPCKTLLNARDIAIERGFKTIYVIGNLSLVGIPPGIMVNYTFIGEGHHSSIVTIMGVQCIGCHFKEVELIGTFGNGSNIVATNCELGNINNITIDAYYCELEGTIVLNDSIASNFSFCSDAVAGSGTPIIDVDDCEALGFWSYSGGLRLTNMAIATEVSVNFSSGRLILDASCTAGNIIVRGIGSIVDNSAGTTVNDTGLLDQTSITNAVWNETITNHSTVGSAGKALQNASSAGDPWSTELPGSYTGIQAGKLLTQIQPSLSGQIAAVPDPWSVSLPGMYTGDQAGKLIGEIQTTITDAISAIPDPLTTPDGIENNITLKQALQVMLAVISGRASGGGTTSIKFKDPTGVTDRVIMTVDDKGDRSNVNLNT